MFPKIGVNLCQSVDETNHRLAQIFSVFLLRFYDATTQRPND